MNKFIRVAEEEEEEEEECRAHGPKSFTTGGNEPPKYGAGRWARGTLSRYQKKTPVADLLASHAGIFMGARFSSLPTGGMKDELP